MKRSSGDVKIPALSRKTIDAWRISEAGLPTRVVHCTRKLGLQTVGELRVYPPERLLSESRFGQRSLASIHTFFESCAALETGRVFVRDVRDAFEQVLAPRPWEMLRLRYGLERADFEVSPQFTTLQAIANRDGITRERVRQVLNQAFEQVQSQWARTLLEPFENLLIDRVAACGGMSEADVFTRLAHQPEWGGLNPASTALLMSEAHADRWTHFGQVFITAPEEQVHALIAAIRTRLKSAARPIPARALWPDACPLSLKKSGTPPDVILLLQQMEDILLFRDGSCLSGTRLPDIVEETLRALGGVASFPEVTDAVNRRLHPYSHTTTSTIHRVLSVSDRFENTSVPGVYRFRATDMEPEPASEMRRPVVR